MVRNLKVLGLPLVAMLAMSAVVAQAAFAAEEFHAEQQKAVITGEAHPQAPNQVFRIFNAAGTIERANVTCTGLKLEGTAEGSGSGSNWTSPSLTLHPIYSGCSSSTVNTEECHYQFAATTNANGHAAVNVECPTGQSIKITNSFGCNIAVGPQTITGAHYTNIQTAGKPKEITAHATFVHNITYTASGAACALIGVASGTNATYEGTTTLRAFEDISIGSTGNYVEGSQIGISKE